MTYYSVGTSRDRDHESPGNKGFTQLATVAMSPLTSVSTCIQSMTRPDWKGVTRGTVPAMVT